MNVLGYVMHSKRLWVHEVLEQKSTVKGDKLTLTRASRRGMMGFTDGKGQQREAEQEQF